MATSQRTQVALAPKKAPGKAGTAVSNIISNGFPIYCTKNLPFFKYDLRILAFFPNAAKPKEITKQLNEDFSEVERKKVQAKLLTILANREQDFFPGGVNSFVTDRAACLYSLDKYPILDPIGGHVFDMYTHEFGDIDLVQRAEKITVTITPCGENFQGTTNNYDNLFREFANIAVSHEAYQHNDLFVVANNGILIIEPEQLGFSADEAPTLPGSAKALPEIKKSVKIVEGPNYSPGIAPSVILSLDVSKHPIHMATFLLEKVKAVYMECGGRRAPRTFNLVEASRAPHVLNAIRNLEVLPTHRENARPFSIKGFGGAANREMIPDMRISVADFFKQQYKLQLRFPEGPTVRDNRGSLFPIEVLKVCPLQKVRKHQEFPEQTEKCTAAAASLPHKRKNQIFNALNGLNLETDVFMRKAGMCVTPEMIKIKSARAIFPPRIVYSGGQGENVQGGKWRLNRNRFYKAVRVDKWQVWANVEDRNLETVNAFIDEFRSRARNRGVELKEPEKLHLATDQMDEHMADAKERGFQFIFMISEDYEDCHKRLKYLEVKYNLPTQNLTMRVARNAATKHQGVTFDNIIMKTNIKNRGLNHDIQYQQANLQNLVSHVDRLIIGIEMSHGATGADKDRSASIVGWSANCLQHPTQYTGNFLFVKARDTEPDLSPVFKQVLGRLQKYRKQPPKFVDIFMGGVSEGQLARVARSAVSKLLDTCSVLKFKPEVTLVAVSQDHVERFFRSDNDGQGNSIQQSVQPGLVIDREVVSPSRSEFFLVSCLPLQGTIKVPKYIVCVDTSGKRTMDDIETQAYGLAHLHQYNTATTSIPTPLYCARDYAQRGADVAPFIVKNDLPNMEFSLDLLNQVTYQRTPLDDVRMA